MCVHHPRSTTSSDNLPAPSSTTIEGTGEGRENNAIAIGVSLPKAAGNPKHQSHPGLTNSEGIKKDHFSRQLHFHSEHRERHPVAKIDGRLVLQNSTSWIRTTPRVVSKAEGNLWHPNPGFVFCLFLRRNKHHRKDTVDSDASLHTMGLSSLTADEKKTIHGESVIHPNSGLNRGGQPRSGGVHQRTGHARVRHGGRR